MKEPMIVVKPNTIPGIPGTNGRARGALYGWISRISPNITERAVDANRPSSPGECLVPVKPADYQGPGPDHDYEDEGHEEGTVVGYARIRIPGMTPRIPSSAFIQSLHSGAESPTIGFVS